MPYKVSLPDGRTVEFPDSVSREEASAILDKEFGPKAGPGKTFLKRFGLAAGPAAAGLAGAELGTALFPGVGTAVGAGIGLLGGIAGSMLTGAAQQKLLEANPELAKRMGIDPETLAAEEKENPKAAGAGELAAMAATMRPSVSGTAALFGRGERAAEALSRELGRHVTPEEATSIARKTAAIGAGLGGTGDVIQQKLTRPEEDIDWGDVAKSTAIGGTFTKTTGLGRRIGNLGRRVVGAEPIGPEGHVPTTAEEETAAPQPTEEELAAQHEETLAQAARNARASDTFRRSVLDALGDSPTIKSFRAATGLDQKTAKVEMDRLVNEGYLTHDAKTGRYSLVPENAQYSFVNEGEKPRAALNEVPVEAPPVEPKPPEVSRRQMDLFEGRGGTDQPLYVTPEGNVTQFPRGGMEHEDLFRAHAAELQRQAQERAATKPAKAMAKPVETIPETTQEQQGFDFTEHPAEPVAPAVTVGEKVFDEETYNKALDAVVANGKATIPVVMKATGAKRSEALSFIDDLKTRGIIDHRNMVISAEGTEHGAPAGARVGGRGEGAELPVPQQEARVGEPAAPVGEGLERPVAATEAVTAGEKAGETPLEATEAAQPAEFQGLSHEARLDVVRNLFKESREKFGTFTAKYAKEAKTAFDRGDINAREYGAINYELQKLRPRYRLISEMLKGQVRIPESPKAAKAEAAPKDIEAQRSEYKSRAIDALDEEKISDSVYEKIDAELKKPAPSFQKIDGWLSGEAVVGSRRAPTAKDEERIVKAKAEKQRLKDIEAEADRMLRESGMGDFDPNVLRFQRAKTVSKTDTPQWYYSRLKKVVDELPDVAFGSYKALENKLRNTPGIKKDELEASGLAEHIELMQGLKLPASEIKKDVQEFLANGGFQLKETVHKQAPETAAYKAYKARYDEVLRERASITKELDELLRPLHEHIEGLLNSDSRWTSNIRAANSTKQMAKQLAESLTYKYKYAVAPEDFNKLRFVKDAIREDFGYFPQDTRAVFDTLASGISPAINEDTLRKAVDLNDRYGVASDKKYRLENILDREQPEKAPYSTYVQPGEHSNYRLFLLRDPTSKFTYLHFGEPGVLAHIRTTDRVGPNGEKTLFVEEIQSDWEQRLRDKELVKTFKDEFDKIPEDDRDAIASDYGKYLNYREAVDKGYNPEPPDYFAGDSPEYLAYAKKVYRYQLAKEHLKHTEHATKGPFVTDGQAISRLALKRVLSQAAHEGYDRVEFVRGEEAKEVMGGDLGGQKHYYNELLPSALRKLVHAENLGLDVHPPGAKEGRLSVELTPEARDKIVADKFSLFQRGEGAKNAVPHEQVVNSVRDATAGWRNPPKIEVVRSTEDLPANLRMVPEDTRGFYDPASKKVYVISENAPSIEAAKGTVFHESLAHYGLQQKFGTDLDTVLSKMYENPNMRRAADAWIKENPDTYSHLGEETNRARAVEEVLANRSEAGTLKESGLQGIYNRVVAAVRDWMRRHGFGVGYSDNDIAQVLRQAHEAVIGHTGESKVVESFDPQVRYSRTPNEQNVADRDSLRVYASEYHNKPQATAELMERGRETLSGVGPAVRRGVFSGMTVNQIASEFERAVPGLRTRHDVLNRKGAEFRKSIDYIADTTEKAHNIFRKYSYAERQRMYNIFHDTTRYQVEVLGDGAKDAERGWVAEDKNHTLYKQFHALPKEVRDVYREMRETYYNQSGVTLQFLRSLMNPSQWRKLEMEWKHKRLKVYLPLFRDGEHWLSYTDKNGEFVKRSFETTYERSRAINEARADGAKDITPYNNFKQMLDRAPPTGFFGDVVRALDKAKVDPAVKEQVVDAYLKLLPNKSVLQMARKREGTAGYEKDPVRAFANVATRQARHIVNMKYNHELESVMRDIRQQVGEASYKYTDNPADKTAIKPETAADLMDNVERSHQLMLDPQYNKLAVAAQYAGYVNYLGGNLSSAVVAATDLPTVVYPMLSRISGFGTAASAVMKASGHFFNSHFHGGSRLPEDVARVLKRGLEDGALGEHRAQDMAEFKTSGTDRYLGIKARVDRVMNAMMGTADKFNREVALMAGYDLYKQKLANKFKGEELHEAAYKAAKQDLYNALGSVFPETNANITHNALGRTVMTFKKFAMNRNWLLARTFRQMTADQPPEVRKAALMQMLGFFGMAGLFAGVQGMPMVGWGEQLAQLVNGTLGDDETFDATETLKQAVGSLAYKGPVNYFLNLNLSDRAGWDNMMWRDDEKRRSDVGFLTFATEQALGPTFSYGRDLGRAYDHFQNGRVERGIETILPKVASNVMKGIRYGIEGATTKDGIPIKQDISAYNALMQVAGFAPADLAEIQKESSQRLGYVKKVHDAHNALLDKLVAAREAGDIDGYSELIDDVQKFNARHPGSVITGGAVRAAMKRYNDRLVRSVHGISIGKRMMPEVMAAYPEEEEE